MKTKKQRRAEAIDRTEARQERATEQQIALIHERRGESRRELKRLTIEYANGLDRQLEGDR